MQHRCKAAFILRKIMQKKRDSYFYPPKPLDNNPKPDYSNYCPISDYFTMKWGSELTQEDFRKLLIEYNSLYKEMDRIYHSLARYYGLSDCAFWLLYTIRESDSVYIQSKLCEMLSLSKQTVNSALKTLEAAGYIEVKASGANRKNKQIWLTEKGLRFVTETIDDIFVMEQKTFEHFSAEDRALFLSLNRQYVSSLHEEASKILTGQLASPKSPST